jgi:hypothetical protein
VYHPEFQGRVFTAEELSVIDSVRGALADPGQSGDIRPIATSERLPDASECDVNGNAWWWYDDEECGFWELIDPTKGDPLVRYSFWLPFGAIPIPE